MRSLLPAQTMLCLDNLGIIFSEKGQLDDAISKYKQP